MRKPSRTYIDYTLYLAVLLWFAFSVGNTVTRMVALFTTASQAISNSDDQNRLALYGEFYRYLNLCIRQTSPDSTVFMVTDNLFFYYYGAYYLYPRRLLINSPDKRVDGLTPFTPFWPNDEFLKTYKVSLVFEATQSSSFRLVRTD